jgi:tetratricopeptide (TPR) repeat protein
MYSLGKRGSQFMYGESNRGALGGDDYIPPQAYKVSHDVNDRVHDFRRIFASDPSSPRALFEAAQVLEQHNYYDESAEMYREIIQLFHKDSAVWAEANFRLASLHENALFNRLGAIDILKRIVNRAPETEYGRLAKTRLSEMDSPETASGMA